MNHDVPENKKIVPKAKATSVMHADGAVNQNVASIKTAETDTNFIASEEHVSSKF